MPPLMKYCPARANPLEVQRRGGRPRHACPSCGFVFYDNPVPVVAALLEHGQTMLLVRNKGWPEKWFGLTIA